ncbi:MAG: GMC family oxidoreductase [Amphiplicatus sp.]
MEHFNITLGRFITFDSELWSKPNGLNFTPSAETLRRLGIGSSFLTFHTSTQPKHYGRLAPLRKAMREITCSSDFLLKQARKNGEVVCSGDGTVTTIMEQSPNKESRILLDHASRDRFDRPRLKLDWRINDQDLKTIRLVAEETGKAFAEQNIARLRIAPEIVEGGHPDLGMHSHHMGTTRMSALPRDGVVDGDCRVHGVENLFIGGSSVFPTGGGCNPTFTIVCLALRLGDHISRNLGLG